ncbi:class I SAM-dependent methyltransferase [Streptomyces lunaelactis]|uniref:class I SAM-dependent methyltransferase n=1 Tax=Streptomyces lunaelactis TaxID=1535768 RepID=UPI00158452D3|nr:class I SAM-dependent methyltransferase [Streptomyces lunaelactis]NUK23686.1 class I SAM-dependent methyltransferase [Streptomyces lunaelactis]
MTADPHAFVSAESHYARFRPRYPDELYTLLADRFRLDGTQRALDLGCGPGTVALELAGLVGTVFAVDPAEAMLEHGQALAEERNVRNVRWQQGDSSALLGLGLPPIDLAVMAKSFHWMDRVQVLADLDKLTTPYAGVVILSAGPPGTTPLPGWAAVVAEVRSTYLGTVRRAGSGVYPEPKETYQATVERSPFSAVEVVPFDQLVVRSLEELIGLQLSNSYSTPTQLGPRREAFEEELRRALLAFDPSGRYEETIHTDALIATRV